MTVLCSCCCTQGHICSLLKCSSIPKIANYSPTVWGVQYEIADMYVTKMALFNYAFQQPLISLSLWLLMCIIKRTCHVYYRFTTINVFLLKFETIFVLKNIK